MNIKLHFLIPILLGGFLTVHAQNNAVKSRLSAIYAESDKKELRKILVEAAEKYNVSNVERRALELNAPMVYTDFRGRTAYAVGVNRRGEIIYRTSFNSGSRLMSNVNDISPDGSLGLNLDGTGMMIGVWDGDVGLGSHVEFAKGNSSRLIMKEKPLTDTYKTKDDIESRAHATHVAGTIGASGKESNAKGMAPNATIISYNWRNDISEMNKEALGGLLVSNHSYGIPAYNNSGVQIPLWMYGAYDEQAMEVDALTNVYTHYLPVYAAGNDGWYRGLKPNLPKDGNDLLISTSTAKNSVIVAAVEQISTYTGPESVHLAVFSSSGPTNDFRIKPDISAKGVNVYSSSYMSDTNTSYYERMNGTSMAAPAVTGIIALWQQWAIEHNKMPYISSTIKAIMIHSALEAGPEPGPDHKFGWGLINARNGVQVMMAAKAASKTIIEENTLHTNQVYSKKFTVGTNGTKFKATIAWIDPETPDNDSNYDENYVLNNPILINDLDLRVFKDGEEYKPWKLNKNFKMLIVGTGDNDVDNVEQVEINNPEAGEYEIRVSHKKTLKQGKQLFSLVASTDADEVAIVDPPVSKTLALWPNPVVDKVNIVLPESYDVNKAEVTVFDVNGRKVAGASSIQVIDNGILQVSMDGFGAGVYFIEIKQDAFKQVEKIMKK